MRRRDGGGGRTILLPLRMSFEAEMVAAMANLQEATPLRLTRPSVLCVCAVCGVALMCAYVYENREGEHNR